jgi:hypothetical protein
MSRQIAKGTSTRIDWSAFTTISKMMPPHDPDEEDEDEEDPQRILATWRLE